jgi:MtN3 and saliva related transmembrane protein
MDKITILGLIAASFTTFSFVPQAMQVIRTRDTKGLSLTMYILFTAGIALWLVYGLLLRDIPIILANIVTLVLALTILGMKMKHG